MGADQVVTLFKYKQWIDAETLQAHESYLCGGYDFQG